MILGYTVLSYFVFRGKASLLSYNLIEENPARRRGGGVQAGPRGRSSVSPGATPPSRPVAVGRSL